MYLKEYLLPVSVITTVLYLLSVIWLYLKSKKNRKYLTDIKDVGDTVKSSVDGVTTKVHDISKSIDESMMPALRNVESEMKKMYCSFDEDIIYEKLKSEGYPSSVMMESGTIVSMVKWDLGEQRIMHVTHFVTVESKNSAILVESYALKLNTKNDGVYKKILQMNFERKTSDFGLLTIGASELVVAQEYIQYPKDSFHSYPLVEGMDDLERSIIQLKKYFDENDIVYENFDIKGLKDIHEKSEHLAS